MPVSVAGQGHGEDVGPPDPVQLHRLVPAARALGRRVAPASRVEVAGVVGGAVRAADRLDDAALQHGAHPDARPRHVGGDAGDGGPRRGPARAHRPAPSRPVAPGPEHRLGGGGCRHRRVPVPAAGGAPGRGRGHRRGGPGARRVGGRGGTAPGRRDDPRLRRDHGLPVHRPGQLGRRATQRPGPARGVPRRAGRLRGRRLRDRIPSAPPRASTPRWRTRW